LPQRLLKVLRCYFRAARPKDYFFPSWREGPSVACRNAAARAGIAKRVTAHTLRHYTAYGISATRSQPICTSMTTVENNFLHS
jgi:integrase